TEGNPVRFTDPSGYTSYEGMMNRMAKDLAKAAIAEVSSQGDIMAFGLQKIMRDRAHQQEKRLKHAIDFQLIKSTVFALIGAAILIFAPMFAPLGYSLLASGLAGLAGYGIGGHNKGHFDRAKALRSSKLAAGIASIAMFIYSFGDYGYGELVQEAKDANDVLDVAYKIGENFWESISHLEGVQYLQGLVNNTVIFVFSNDELYLLPFFPEQYNINITAWTGISSLNFPGYISYVLTYLSVKDVAAYNPDIRKSRRASLDNNIYYYRESVKKGLYYLPYIVNIIEGE
ncbi:MAG: hypothetical protein KDK90_27630, partial [Leptospiraceae bacterium]|nr:hypothetical protein [Leptospiraceae bacterium]